MQKETVVSCLAIMLLIITSCDKELSVTPPDSPPSEAGIVLSTNPSGYSIFLDDRITGRNTPDSLLYLTSGEHRIEFRHHFYLDTALTVTLDSNKTISLDVDVEGHPQFRGSFYLRSNPPKAEIILDDALTGKNTPDSIPGVYPGIHKITLRKFGYRDYDDYVTMNSNELIEINATLEDTTIWVVYNHSNSAIPSENINCISGKDGWIGSLDNGVIKYDAPDFINYNPNNSILFSYAITDMHFFSNDNIIAASYYGTYIFDVQTGNWSEYTNGITNAVGVLRRYGFTDEVYLCTERGLIMNKGSNLHTEFYHVCTSISISNRGQVAVGTRSSGVFIQETPESNWINYKSGNSQLTPGEISAVSIFKNIYYDTEIYVAIKQGLATNPKGVLHRYYNNEWTEIEYGEHRIYAIDTKSTSTWLGTANGIYKIKYGEIVNHYNSVNSPLPSDLVYDVKDMGSGGLWIATFKGLIIYKYINDTGSFEQ